MHIFFDIVFNQGYTQHASFRWSKLSVVMHNEYFLHKYRNVFADQIYSRSTSCKYVIGFYAALNKGAGMSYVTYIWLCMYF